MTRQLSAIVAVLAGVTAFLWHRARVLAVRPAAGPVPLRKPAPSLALRR
jgi:hypothetical protein